MRRVFQRRQFLQDLKKQEKRGKDPEKLFVLVHTLAGEGRLPSRFRSHKLSGEYDGQWECHIEPDWLLTYEISKDAIILARTGSHADLFG